MKENEKEEVVNTPLQNENCADNFYGATGGVDAFRIDDNGLEDMADEPGKGFDDGKDPVCRP